MHDGHKINLSKHRLTCAKEALEEAEGMLKICKYKGANNRAYYAIFHSLRAILALEGFDARKHSGIIARFNEKYVKSNIFPTKIGKMIANASAIRNNSDYDDFFIATSAQAENQVKDAKIIYDMIKLYINRECS